MSEDPFEEYKQKKKQHAEQQQPLSQKQRIQQELRKLPQGKELMNWICQEVANRIGDPVVWQYADRSEATQQRTHRVEFFNGRTNNRLIVTEINRQEIARIRAMGQNWIQQFMAAINGGKSGSASQMHKKFEEDLSERFGDKMDKIIGNDE